MAMAPIKNGRIGPRQIFFEPAHLAHVLFAGQGMDDASRRKEEKALEEGVGVEMKDAGRVGADAAADEHISELRDGRIGEDPLDVVLGEGHGRGKDRGQRADEGDDRTGRPGKSVEEIHPGDHVDAGRDHRRGVDQGADGRRAFHGVGKPDIKRKLGGFARGSDKKKDRDERRQPLGQ